MVTLSQGEIWWAELGEPSGSGPEYRRPVIVVQGNPLNQSRLATAVCVPMTSNLVWAHAPGNVLITAKESGLPKDSVANPSQIVSLDRAALAEPVGKLSARTLKLVITGIDIILGR